MAAPHLRLWINYPRTELKTPGFGKSIPSSVLSIGRVDGSGASGTTDEDGEFTPYKGELPENLWSLPQTGAILLRPTVLSRRYLEDPSTPRARLTLDKWRHGTGSILQVSDRGDLLTQRASASAGVNLIGVVAKLNELAIELGGTMGWVMETLDVLAPNEGWSVWCSPYGIYTDRAQDWLTIAFGGQFALHLQMAGKASLMGYKGGEWSTIAQIDLSQGGVDPVKPFQLTCIPCGYGGLVFTWSNDTLNYNKPGRDRGGIYVDVAARGYECPWDETTSQYVKTQAAPLSVAMRQLQYQYGLSWSRVRYPAYQNLIGRPISTEELHVENDPVLTLYGFDGQKLGQGKGGSQLVGKYYNELRETYDKESDFWVLPSIDFMASEGNVYTPELWSMDLSVAEETVTPNWAPRDRSAFWKHIEWTSTAASEVATMELELKRDDEADQLLKLDGPIRLECKSLDGESFVPIFDGYITDSRPTLDGVWEATNPSQPVDPETNPLTFSLMMADTPKVVDMWDRLDSSAVGTYKSFNKRKIGDILTEMILKAGFTAEEVDIPDDPSHWYETEFEGWVEASSFDTPTEDSMIGDVIRDLIGKHGFQQRDPIRVRWTGEQWKVYMPPVYEEGVTPLYKFYLDHSLVPSDAGGDVARWLAGHFYVTSKPEFAIARPEFNTLSVIGHSVWAEGRIEGETDVDHILKSTARDIEAIADPTSINFEGRIRASVFGGGSDSTSKNCSAKTQEENDKIARTLFDQRGYMQRIVSFSAEWQPPIDVDDFVWLIGRKTGGQRVSFGAYRVDSLKRTFDQDHGSDRHDTRFDFSAAYTAAYVGRATDDDTPMFSELLP